MTSRGIALKFAVGTTYTGIVSRTITNEDIIQQTDPLTGAPQFYRDGRAKFVMRVPLTVPRSPEHPDGRAQWYCKATGILVELIRAMIEADAPEGPPEKGAVIEITCLGTQPSTAGFNPTKIYSIMYRRPGDVKYEAWHRPPMDSPAEESFWDAYDRIRPPELDGLVTQLPALGYFLDFAVLAKRVAIEIDGYAYHSSKEQFENDRRRHRALEMARWRVIRFSGKEALNQPDECVREAARFARLVTPLETS